MKKYICVMFKQNPKGSEIDTEYFEIPDGEDVMCIQKDEGYKNGNEHLIVVGLKLKPDYIYDQWENVIFFAVAQDMEMLTSVIHPVMVLLKVWWEQQTEIENSPDCDNCDDRKGDPPDNDWRD